MKNKKMLITLIVLLAVGFASVSTTLIITGIVGIASNESDFNIIFTNAQLNNVERKDFIEQTKKQTLTFATDKLTTIDESAVLDYEVTNTSRIYDADVKIECNLVDEEENVIENSYINIQYQPNSMELLAGETKSGSITARLIKASTEDQSVQVKCTLNANALERDTLGEEYVGDLEPFSKAGTLKSTTFSNTSDFWKYKRNITKVVFEDRINEHETSDELIFDVSDVGDGSVMSYLVANGEELTEKGTLTDTTAYTLYISSNTGVKENNGFTLFRGFYNLKEIENIEFLDTSNDNNMSYMFDGCINLIKLDLSKFDTSNVTDMSYMFGCCSNLISLDISNFDTSKVTEMNDMFDGCNKLIILNLSNFNTSNVTNMEYMFYECNNLYRLDLSGFDTQNVKTMHSMFNGCSNLTSLDVSNFDTSNVTDMSYMFQGCSKLKKLDISNFNTSNVTDMSYMFQNCTNLVNLDISNFDVSNVQQMSCMFTSMPKEAIVKVKDENTQSSILRLSGIFDRPSDWTTDNVIIA